MSLASGSNLGTNIVAKSVVNDQVTTTLPQNTIASTRSLIISGLPVISLTVEQAAGPGVSPVTVQLEVAYRIDQNGAPIFTPASQPFLSIVGSTVAYFFHIGALAARVRLQSPNAVPATVLTTTLSATG
jgi:hypothetical protein